MLVLVEDTKTTIIEMSKKKVNNIFSKTF